MSLFIDGLNLPKDVYSPLNIVISSNGLVEVIDVEDNTLLEEYWAEQIDEKPVVRGEWVSQEVEAIFRCRR